MKRKFREIANNAVLALKNPVLDTCLHWLVRFDFSDQSHPIKSELNRTRGNSWGHVAQVDIVRRVLSIKFFDFHAVEIFKEEIPFDHPHLHWYIVPGLREYQFDAAMRIQAQFRGR